MACGRLAQVQAFGRAYHTALVQDGFKDQQKVEIERSKVHRLTRGGEYSFHAWAKEINAFAGL
jgi:hypothetical protein